MQWFDWAIPLGAIVAFFLSSAWLLVSFIEHRSEQKNIDQFRGALVAAISHSEPSWDQVLDVAHTYQLAAVDAFRVCRLLHRDILTGELADLTEHRGLVEGYISRHREAEPFEGLPTATRIHLERVKEALAGREHLLDPLTAQVRDLLAIHERETRALKRYTVWGFLVGLLGLLIAAYGSLYPV